MRDVCSVIEQTVGNKRLMSRKHLAGQIQGDLVGSSRRNAKAGHSNECKNETGRCAG
jgi:hypothetical protein